MVEPDERSTFRRIVRDLPRKTVAFIVLVVLLNVVMVVSERGRHIAVERSRNGYGPSYCLGGPVPPWEWTADEWRKTFLWK